MVYALVGFVKPPDEANTHHDTSLDIAEMLGAIRISKKFEMDLLFMFLS